MDSGDEIPFIFQSAGHVGTHSSDTHHSYSKVSLLHARFFLNLCLNGFGALAIPDHHFEYSYSARMEVNEEEAVSVCTLAIRVKIKGTRHEVRYFSK